MKLLILSDSHSASLSSFDFEKYDMIFHCGDYGKEIFTLEQAHIYFVKGNCDTIGQESLILDCYGKRIWLTHGHKENVKYDIDRLIYKALEHNVDVVFFGHTHVSACFVEEGILFINPGSYPTSFVEIDEEKITIYINQTKKTITYRW